ILRSSYFVHPSASAQSLATARPGHVDTLGATGGLPPEICNVFREPLGIQQTSGGVYYVFDRRGHAVYSVDPDARGVRKVVEIGGESGRLLEPTAFDVRPDGRFAVADAPNGRERVQVFDFAGNWISGFTLPGRAQTRISINGLALGGVSTLAFLGTSVALNQPETGALVTEYGLAGTPLRSVGTLRGTGHEADRQLHLAMNTGIPLPHPDGGYFFVFFSGAPVFRRYDARGLLMFERVMQGRELDPVLANMPRTWPRRAVDGGELPLVAPTVRTAAIDQSGHLWVSFVIPFSYVFDAEGEKVRTVQFRGAGVITPSSLFFTEKGRLLATPGCYQFLVVK
ncbi:MAG: hypothetical protein ACRD1H_09735, partial [Vicinamibacterales bacterium]